MRLTFLAMAMAFTAFGLEALPYKAIIPPSAAQAPGKIVWEYAKTPQIELKGIPADWSGYKAFSMDVEPVKPSTGRLHVIFVSNNPDFNGFSYYSASFAPNFKGKLTLRFALKDIGHVRKPAGWQKIDQIIMHNDWGKTKDITPDAVIKITNMKLLKGEDMKDEKGPRMTDEDLFEALDLERPELASVKTAWQKGDLAAARHALAQHLRTRTYPRWKTNPLQRPTRGGAPITERSSTGNGGRYQLLIPIDWTGWKLVTLDKKAFSSGGKPAGWNCISGLALHWEAPATMKAGTPLFLDDFRLEGNNGDLNLGDFEQQVTGWAGIYASEEMPHNGRRSGRWLCPDIVPIINCHVCPSDMSRYDRISFWMHAPEEPCGRLLVRFYSNYPDTKRADQILTRNFAIGSFQNVPVNFGKRIDWSCNPMDKGETKTVEWNAQLNRHFHFSYLADAYWRTGDDKYAAELAEEWNSWIEDCPVLLMRSGNGPYHYAWETLNTGIRVHGSWPDALYKCIESPAFTDDILVNIMKSSAEHVRHLMRWPSRGNWLTAEHLGIYVAGALYPEFKEAKAWREEGIRVLYNQLVEEVYPDGMQFELALGYNNWVLNEFLDLYETALNNDLVDELPKDYLARVEKMFAYQMGASMPDGRCFALNDGGVSGIRASILRGYNLFPHRKDFLWMLTNGVAGEPPVTDSIGMRWVGHYLMRSGWTPKANVLLMDSALLGMGHWHQDKLSLCMSAYGKLLLVDGGVTMYDKSRWRAYTLLTRSHNTVIVDDMDQFSPTGIPDRIWNQPWIGDKPADDDTLWFSNRNTDYCQGWYRKQYREYCDDTNRPKSENTKFLRGIQHRRAVQFLKPDLWIVLDTLYAEDDAQHTAQVLYHIQADEAKAEGPAAFTTLPSNEPTLFLAGREDDGLAVSVVTAKEEVPPQGWSSSFNRNRPKGIPVSPAPTAIFQKSWKKRVDLVTVVFPSPSGYPRSVKCLPVAAPEGIQAAKLEFPKENPVYWFHSDKPGTLVEGKGFRLDGQSGVTALTELHLVDGQNFSSSLAGEASVTLSAKASFSVTGVAEGVFAASSDKDTKVAVSLPSFPADKLPKLFAVDRRSARIAEVPVKVSGKTLSWDAKAGQEYEIAYGNDNLQDTRKNQVMREVRKMPEIKVKALPELPAAPASVLIKVQAEDIAAQGEGSVTITKNKIGAEGAAFLHWDYTGHWLEYAFDVPQDGAYQLQLRYSLGDTISTRCILIDGACPDELLKSILFEDTGGWCTSTDDWATMTVFGAKDTPFPFYLKKGRHTIRLINVTGSLNLDYLQFKGLKE